MARYIHYTDPRSEEMVRELEVKANEVQSKIYELYVLREATIEALGRYQAALTAGERLMTERELFRKRTAIIVQDYRYQDLAFRVFRNDAVQKYRASFDLAQRYAYLAATAYDFETNLLRTDEASGAGFLTGIVRQRALGEITGGVPMVGRTGLADSLARLSQNFDVFNSQLGFNNPQTETNPFSLRSENFHIKATSDAEWKEVLAGFKVADLMTHQLFKRYCRPFAPDTADTRSAQPGLVIPFSTVVQSGKNFFGWPLGTGDSSYDPSHFATKVRSVGVWFKGYDGAGLSSTPRAYLVPVGADVLRSPAGDGFAERWWQVVDQKLPVPFPLSAVELENSNWLPMNSLSEDFGGIRKFSSFRAYNDDVTVGTGPAKIAEMNADSRLIGRSVWNTQWALIIPGAALLADPAAGIEAFINNVRDIRLFFQTYAYSGN